MKRLCTGALIAACLAPLAGCGGATSTGWLDQADAICRAHKEALAPLRARFEALARTGLRTPGERAAAAAILRRGLLGLQREITDLRQLYRPAGEEASSAADILGLLGEKRLKIGEGLIEAFESGSAPRTNALVETLIANEERTEQLARRVGLRVCGHP